MSHDARTSPVLRIRAECKASDEDEAPLTPGQRARQILAGARFVSWLSNRGWKSADERDRARPQKCCGGDGYDRQNGGSAASR